MLVGLLSTGAYAQIQEGPLNIIAVFAHPDDADSKMGGTAALMDKMGHNVKFVSSPMEMLDTTKKGVECWLKDGEPKHKKLLDN